VSVISPAARKLRMLGPLDLGVEGTPWHRIQVDSNDVLRGHR
jgi:hypothetical protein